MNHDRAMASQSTFATTLGSLARGLGMALLFAISFGFAGVVVGAIVGRLSENPNDMLASLNPEIDAIFGFPIGALLGLALFAITRLKD